MQCISAYADEHHCFNGGDFCRHEDRHRQEYKQLIRRSCKICDLFGMNCNQTGRKRMKEAWDQLDPLEFMLLNSEDAQISRAMIVRALSML